MPEETKTSYFQLILPRRWSSHKAQPVCLHLAGTGDHVCSFSLMTSFFIILTVVMYIGFIMFIFSIQSSHKQSIYYFPKMLVKELPALILREEGKEWTG